MIYTRSKSKFSFEPIFRDQEITDLNLIVQLKRASIFTSFGQNEFSFYPMKDDLAGNYTIPFNLFNLTIKKKSEQTFKLLVVVKRHDQQQEDNKCPLPQIPGRKDACLPKIKSISNSGIVNV